KVLSYSFRWFVSLTALVFALVVSRGVAAQSNPDPFGFKFNSGQSVQPIFEGWSKTSGGGFLMHFGYLNRNYVETMEIPVGPDNKLDPGDPDRGQPTFFNARIHRMAFSVPVPGDWGKKELVWSVTVHGRTEKAVGWLEPEWEIDPIYFGKKRTAESLKNTPPKLTLDVPAAVTLPNALTLTATVADDGLP